MISSTAIFAASDIAATLAYYKDVLGFESTWTWGDPPVFGSASTGGVTITFELRPALATMVRGHPHGVKVEDADALFRLHTSRNAHIVSDIEDKPWGIREYTVEDLNGYHLRFSGPPASDAPKSNPFPEGATIELRKPTGDEYASVAGGAFGYKNPDPWLLENTWNGIVARSPGGETIGILRIMWDAPGWFSIWDVAVLPDWQARRVGSTMMKEALDMIREASPNANVHLFTTKDGFYERLGFTKETVSIRRL
ncbi:MAG: GNAT family N-acetyltransferase [Fimbriimonadaceae bacterium]